MIRTRYHSSCGSYMVEMGTIHQKMPHRLRKSQLNHFRRHGVQPKKKITEFRVSPDACLPSGMNLTLTHELNE